MKFKYYLRGAGIGIIVTTVILSAASLFQDNMSDAEIIQRAMDLGMVMEEGPSGTLADMPGQGQSSNANSTSDGVQTVSDDGQLSAPDDGQPSTSGDDQPDVSDDDQNTGAPTDATGDGQKEPAGNADGQNGTDTQGDGTAQPGTPTETGKDVDNGDGEDNAGQDKDHAQKADSKKQDNGEKKITLKVEGGDVSRSVSQRAFEVGLVSNADEFNQYLGDNGYANFLQPGTYHIKKGASFEQIAKILTNK